MDWLPWALSLVLAVAVIGLIIRPGASLRLGREQRRLSVESEALQSCAAQLDAERRDLDVRRAKLDRAQEAAEAERIKLDSQLAAERSRVQAEIERVARLTPDEARREIVESVREDAARAGLREAKVLVERQRESALRDARALVVEAIQRVAVEQTAETVISTIPLPAEEMKGRIIGKEGRNIRAFEQLTGANVLIDEGPAVTVSCFDPLRREKARLTLEALVADGNIHPARIEHVFAKAERRVEERMYEAATDALLEVGIVDLPPSLLVPLGRLAYRTSYGQTVLQHLIECAHLAGAMAAELGIDVAQCKRAAFLHDIGKAFTQEQEGSHALIGADLLRKAGENEDIVHAVAAHHNEIAPQTIEAVLTQAVDAISGSRPGARRPSLEAYLERMESLERIAVAHEGVAKAFAMQSGHEVRVMVQPSIVDDAAAEVLAHDIAAKISAQLTFPGAIRVTVVRESRATAVAQ